MSVNAPSHAEFDAQPAIGQHAPPMPGTGRNSAHGNSIDELADSITVLSQQVEVLRNVMDEFREDFSWAVRNERPVQSQHFILKRMAADPTDPRWADRLEIVHCEPVQPEPSRIPQGIDGLFAVVEQLACQTDEICSQLASVRKELSDSLFKHDAASQDGTIEVAADRCDTTGPQVQRSLFRADDQATVT